MLNHDVLPYWGDRRRFASGCVAAGGTSAVLIPPSGVLIIYSIATGISIVDLFIAAFIPGILTALIYAALITAIARAKPDLAPPLPRQRIGFSGRMRALVDAWEILVLFLVVMGSIYLGVATATEAAAFGAATALLMLLWRRGRNSGKELRVALVDAAGTTASVLALIVGAGFFSLALATTHVATMLAEQIIALNLPPISSATLRQEPWPRAFWHALLRFPPS